MLDPGDVCPDCGGELRLLGEDINELLDYVSAKLKVLQIARLKKSCRACEKIIQEPAPSTPIQRGMAGAGLLSHILVSKFDDHLPLYRQGEIFARLGIDIPRSTLIGWTGSAIAELRPIAEFIGRSTRTAIHLHCDDTIKFALHAGFGPTLMVMNGPGHPEFGEVQSRALELCRLLGAQEALLPLSFGAAVYQWGQAEFDHASAPVEALTQSAEDADDEAALMAADTVSVMVSLHRCDLATVRSRAERLLRTYDLEKHRSLYESYMMDFATL